MKFLFNFDKWLLGLTEKFCHWFQKQTGWTNFSLGFLAAILATALTFIDLAQDVYESKGLRLGSAYRYVGAAYFLFQIFRIRRDQAYLSVRRLANRTANPLKTDRVSRFIRIFLLLSVILMDGITIFKKIVLPGAPNSGFFSTSWVGSLGLWSYIACMYLIACDPLPPCSGKFFDRLRNMLAWALPASAENN